VQVSFSVAQKTLERLEWPRVLDRLRELAQTPGGRHQFAAASAQDAATPGVFDADPRAVRDRLAETSEARSLLAAGESPPLGGVGEVEGSLARAVRGGVLTPAELRELAATAAALDATGRFFEPRAAAAPRLAARAGEIGDHRELVAEIERCIDAGGELSDAASPELAAARRESRRLAAEIQSRAAAYLRDPGVVAHLSDSYYTVRNDRFVLPVRAEAKGGIQGIVHDASHSGTTLFVEPQALVELNNRHKRAEIAIERESRRVLRELSQRFAADAAAIEAGLRALASIDAAFARGRYGDELDAAAPEVGAAGIVRLPQLRHPLLPAGEVVPNDIALGDGITTLVISGPNAGGKTVAMKAVALAVLFVRSGLHVPASAGARIDLFDAVLADIGDEQDIREQLSTFSAHMGNLARILASATERSLVVLDEVGVGTDPGEGAALAQAVLEQLADAGARTIATTHYNLLKELAEVDPRFANASVEFDPETLEPTYRLKLGIPGISSARAVAARMGVPRGVLERANEILEREDRQLDHILAELTASRHALERERREAARLRADAESARSEHLARLEHLQKRRDTLFQSMRHDLDRTFRAAHDQVAAVIRDLQRGGSAQDAAQARERLLALETQAREAETAVRPPVDEAEAGAAVDWRRAHAGDPVQVVGAGRGVLEALPDKRGRVAVRVGGARLVVPRERVRKLAPGEDDAPRRPRATLSLQPAHPEAAGPASEPGDAGHCDLRGLRVDEALDRLDRALDRAASAGRDQLVIVHGVGTGALRRAVREQLQQSPYVAEVLASGPEKAEDGITRVVLR